MEDCKAQRRARKCNDNEKSCQQEIRSWGEGGKYKSITQRCKQRHACVNNHIQNPRAAWVKTQCQPFTHPENSVCRCCCLWNYCNGKEYNGCKGLDEAKAEFEKDKVSAVSTTTKPVTTSTITTREGMTVPGITDPITISVLQPLQPECEWGQWTEWDKCSETCGGGQRNRYRNPIGGTVGSPGCEGYGEDVEYCATQDCVEKKCSDNYVDVCFLLPVTNTTTPKDLRLMKSFVRGCQTHIGDFGAEDLQFCVYQYNTDVQEVISLSDSASMNVREFREALDRMVPMSGSGADIGKALTTIHDEGFNESNGWRRNDQIPSVLIVLTDFVDDNSHYQSLLNIHNKAYRVVGVGIGENANSAYMNSIVSQPTDENVFNINSYEKLEDIVDEIGYDICQVDYWRDDQCMFNNGGCAADETCFIQYNGLQCYPPTSYWS